MIISHIYKAAIFSCLLFSAIFANAEGLPADYQTKKAIEKQQLIWEQIELSKYDKLPVKGVNGFDMLNLFKVKYLTKTISHQSDEMPVSRKKIIHTYGSVAKITFIPADYTPKYTGLFDCIVPGICRASVVMYDKNNLQPGLALKFFVDAHSSLNTVALHTIDGQGKNYNFFEYPFSNIIPPAKSVFMRNVLDFFTKAARVFNPDGNAMKVSITPFSKIRVDGKLETTPVAPKQLYFHSNSKCNSDPDDSRDFRIKLGELPAGIKLFDVFVKKSDITDELLLIGEIRLDSKFIASKYGDEKLFFQHIVEE